MIERSALERLTHGELCYVINGEVVREAEWNEIDGHFYFMDDGWPPSCSAQETEEWMPAGVPF